MPQLMQSYLGGRTKAPVSLITRSGPGKGPPLLRSLVGSWAEASYFVTTGWEVGHMPPLL